MLLSIIIPTHDRPKKLSRLLKSILESNINLNDTEIIIIDDKSKVDVKKIINKTKNRHKNIRVIRSDVELFPSGCRNLGIKKSKGKYLLFIDDDNVIDKDMINNLIKCIKNKDVGICGPIMLYYNTKTVWCGGVELNLWTGRSKFLFQGKNVKVVPKKKIYVDVLPNAFITKKEILDEYNIKFDEKKFPIHFEEADFCLKFKELGFEVVCDPKAITYHDISKSTTNVKEKYRLSHLHNPRRAYYTSRNRIIFEKIHASNIQFLVFILFNTLYCIRHIFLLLISDLSWKNKINNIRNYLRGCKDGMFYRV